MQELFHKIKDPLCRTEIITQMDGNQWFGSSQTFTDCADHTLSHASRIQIKMFKGLVVLDDLHNKLQWESVEIQSRVSLVPVTNHFWIFNVVGLFKLEKHVPPQV